LSADLMAVFSVVRTQNGEVVQVDGDGVPCRAPTSGNDEERRSFAAATGAPGAARVRRTKGARRPGFAGCALAPPGAQRPRIRVFEKEDLKGRMR
jgi:hypothetical protein